MVLSLLLKFKNSIVSVAYNNLLPQFWGLEILKRCWWGHALLNLCRGMILLVSSAFWSLLAVPGLEMYYSILMATFPLRVFTSSSLCVRMWPSVQTGSLSAMKVDWIQKSHTQSLLHTTVQPYPWCSLPSTRSHCLHMARPRIIQILCLLFAL